jgi:Ni,Fe-hydrogenase maturation factor
MLLKSLLAVSLALLPSLVSAQAIDPSAPLPTGSNSSRPVQAGTPNATTVLLPPLSPAEVSQELTARLIKLPGVRAVIPVADTPNLLRLVAHNDSLIRIDALLCRLNAQGANRDAEYRRLEANIAAMLVRTDPFKLEQLRVVVRPTVAIDAFETQSAAGEVRNIVVRRPFIGDLEEVVVGDTPTTIALMPATRLTDLQLTPDQAFERGRANTGTETRAITWRLVGGVLEVRASSGYDTSLLVDESVWAGLAQRLGGPVAVIVPTRERIVVGRADRPRDITRLRAILAAEAKGERMLSAKIWVRRGTTWVER